MKKIISILLIAMSVLLPNLGSSSTVTLAWDFPICINGLTGYWVLYGPKGTNSWTDSMLATTDDCGHSIAGYTNTYWGVYSTNSIFIPGITNTSVTISNLVYGQTYCFVALVTNSTIASKYSPEIIYTTPFPSTNSLPSNVQNFRIVQVR